MSEVETDAPQNGHLNSVEGQSLSGEAHLNQSEVRAVFVGTVIEPLGIFMGPHIRSLTDTVDCCIVASDLSLADTYFPEKVKRVEIRIVRNLSPLWDVVAIIRLTAYLKRNRINIVHSITPKGGLVAMASGFLARTPFRLHTFTGQVWVTRTGVWKKLLAGVDRMIASLAHHTLTDSGSQKTFLVQNQIVKPDRITVLADGSVSGVDIERFKPNSSMRRKLREQYGIGSDDTVFLFVGRITDDKGIRDLVEAFDRVSTQHKTVHLMIVGPDEAGLDEVIEAAASRHRGQVHRHGRTDAPESFMAAADVLCLPSYREGFGTVVIEASSVGLPSIVSEIYGLTDAVVSGETGLMHEPGDVAGLSKAMEQLSEDRILRKKLGSAAHDRVIRLFSEDRLVACMRAFYKSHYFAP